MSWVEERMGNEDTDKELSQMLLLGNVAQKTALGKGCRAESVWNMRRRQAGPEGVVGGGGGSLAFVSQRGALWRLGASEGGLLRHKLCGPGLSTEAVARRPL